MPDYDSKIAGDSDRTVDLPVESARFAVLLRLLDLERPVDPYNWKELEDVLALGEQYKFVSIPKLVSFPASRDIIPSTAWPIFSFASKHRFLSLAKAAIFKSVPTTTDSYGRASSSFESQPTSSFRELPGDYSVALVRAIALNPQLPNQSIPEVERWSKISCAFTL